MALCDNQSAPEFTHAPCTPDSDANIFDGTNPAGADYIGKHPGTAFLELQFYPPGWAPWPAGVSCDATKWCAAMAIFSLDAGSEHRHAQQRDCLASVGDEPANFAFVTKSGVPHAPPSPLGATLATFTPNAATDLFMGSGDRLTVDIHDGPNGLTTSIHDLTTGQTGSMTASAANGFAQVNYQPAAATATSRRTRSGRCTRPRASTPACRGRRTATTSRSRTRSATSSTATRPTRPATAPTGRPGRALDDDDTPLLQRGRLAPRADRRLHRHRQRLRRVVVRPKLAGNGTEQRPGPEIPSDSITFSSPLFNGNQNYSRVAFEADLPRIEAADFGGNCDRFTGTGCTNPPPGADFYPIYSTGSSTQNPSANGHCVWQLGGPDIKGTTNTFGGNSAAEYGPLLFSFYPNPNPAIALRTNNFRRILDSNPCPA